MLTVKDHEIIFLLHYSIYSKEKIEFFSVAKKYNCVFSDNDNEDSQKMLRHLELIDDEAAEYEVKIVKIDDPLMAKKYGHRDPPGLGFFRKGIF